jgi:hypothetical protein
MAKKFLTGLNLVVLDADPATGSEGELYFNSSASVAKIYQAGSWSVLGAGGGGTTVSTTEPSSPEIGDSWYKNDTGEFYVYDGTYWVEVNGVIENPPISQEEVQDYIAPLFTSASNTNVTAFYDDINNVINLNTSGSLVSVDSIVYPDYITFDTTPETSSEETGTLSWDVDFETLKLQMNDVSLQIGQEHVIRVKNNSNSVAIPDRTAVMFAGATGDTVKVSPAVSTSASEPELLVGITTQEISADGFGFVTQFGFINNVNTASWSLGDLLYVDPATPGLLTNVKPTAPNWTFPVAAVTRVHASSGRILSRAIPGQHLHDIVDVLISGSVQNNQALVYNSSSTVWTNKSIVNSLYGTEDQIDVSSSNGNIILTLPNNLITPGNLEVTGNFVVSGSTTYINTETLNIEDNIITLNSNVTGSPTENAGIEVERGTEENSSILWNESLQGWDFSNDIYTSAIRNEDILQIDVSSSAGSSGNINLITNFSELNINSDGSIDILPGDVSGWGRYKLTKEYLEFPDLTQQDTAFLGMSNYDTDDLDEGSTNLYFTNERAIDALDSTLSNYLTNSSASSIYLTQTNASSTYLTQVNASTIYQPVGSYLTSESDPVFTSSDAYGIDSTDISNWDTSYSWGNHASAGYSLSSHNHTLDSLSNVDINSLNDGDAIIWSSASSAWVNQVAQGGATTTVSETSPATPSVGDSWYKPSNGSFFIYDGSYWVEVTSVITMSDEEAQDKVAPLFDHANHVNITAFYDDANNEIILTSSATPDLSAYLTASAAAATYLTSESDTLETVTDRGASSTNAITITNATAASSPTTGALIVTGGVGIGEDLYVNNNVYIGGDINITGSISGSLSFINVTDLVVTDPLIYLAEGNPNDMVDIGIFAALNHGSSAYYHAGLIRDASDSGKWKLASQLDDPINNVIDFTSATFDTLVVGSLEVTDASITRTNLGLGTMATQTASNYALLASPTFTGSVTLPSNVKFENGTNDLIIGSYSGKNNSVVFGHRAGESLPLAGNADNIIAIGYRAMATNNWGQYSVAVGSDALLGSGNQGSFNTAIGGKSLAALGGAGSLAQNVSNTAIGYNSGSAIFSGGKNVIIGSNNGSTIDGLSNNIIFSDGDGNIRASYLSSASGWTLGTIVSGDWSGTAISTSKGGTGLTSLGSAGYVLAVNETQTGLEWVPMSGGGGGEPGESLITVWKYTAIGGETSLSGNDDNDINLSYTPGTEELYLNGVNLVRTSDYIATTGTTITNLEPLLPDSVIEIVSYSSFSVANTYTKLEVDNLIQKQGVRWTKVVGAGSSITTLSGSDDSLNTLAYTPATEQVFVNGVLLVRGVDYTATDGTSVVLSTAIITGDVVEIIGNSAFSIANTYTKGELDSKLNLLTLPIINGTTTASGNINPSASVTYDLGTTSLRWRALYTQDLSTSGTTTAGGNINPSASNTYDLGTTSLRWRNIYTQDLHLSNGIGDYTVIEGEEDLFLVNNKSGKSFKFALIEVDPSQVPPKSESN